MKDTIKIELLDKQKSYHEGNEQTVTRVEVYSSLYEEDLNFQNRILDADYEDWKHEELNNVFKGLAPEPKNIR